MKTSYRKHLAQDGTVYRQRITMSHDEFKHLSNAVEAEIAQNLPRKKEYVSTSGYEIFMRPLQLSILKSWGFDSNVKVCYLNNTQARFCNLFLKGILKTHDRNCYIILK